MPATHDDAKLSAHAEHMSRTADEVAQSAQATEKSAVKQTDSADRRTELAADRTLLAAERTYAAWVRTGLAALASGVGSKALLAGVLANWMVVTTGSMLIAFSAFCFVAAVWREVWAAPISPEPAPRRMPRALLLGMNGFLVLVALAVLVGLWVAPGGPRHS